jgi:hypothetical protein
MAYDAAGLKININFYYYSVLAFSLNEIKHRDLCALINKYI